MNEEKSRSEKLRDSFSQKLDVAKGLFTNFRNEYSVDEIEHMDKKFDAFFRFIKKREKKKNTGRK